MKEYFVERGDDKTQSLNVLIPANIRWHHYYKREDVKQENKFAPIGVHLPLKQDLQEAFKAAKAATAAINSSFFEIYATYVMSRLAGKLAPTFLQKQ